MKKRANRLMAYKFCVIRKSNPIEKYKDYQNGFLEIPV
jgi:hypothetical protein